MPDIEEEIINKYKSIDYTREWFDTHKYIYKEGQGYDPYIGEYFLVDLYPGEIWLVKGCKPIFNTRRKLKLPVEPICKIFDSKKIGYVNGYWQLLIKPNDIDDLIIKTMKAAKDTIQDLKKQNEQYLQKLVYALSPTTHELDTNNNNAFKEIIVENINLPTYEIKKKLKDYWED